MTTKKQNVALIDYGVSNLRSVIKALDFLGVETKIVTQPSGLLSYDKLVLPGVGAFGAAMDRLNSSGLTSAVQEAVLLKKIPLFGICLGMQLLFESSTELGMSQGLGVVKGHVRGLAEKVTTLPIPHVGWNTLIRSSSSRLFKNVSQEASFYFVHGFYCTASNPEIVVGRTEYGITFDVAIESENIFACQFHPEKSQAAGLSVMRNFLEL